MEVLPDFPEGEKVLPCCLLGLSLTSRLLFLPGLVSGRVAGRPRRQDPLFKVKWEALEVALSPPFGV